MELKLSTFMRLPSLQQNEELRIKDLYYHDILDTTAEKEFNDLVHLVAHICNCADAIISFVDKDREWIKASKLIKDKEISRQVSFGAHTILKNKVMVVRDVRKDHRFMRHPHVTGDLKVAFYAGAPIISSAGFAIGTISVIDKEPKRVFTPRHKQALKIISAQITRLMDLRVKNKLISDRERLHPPLQKKTCGYYCLPL